MNRIREVYRKRGVELPSEASERLTSIEFMFRFRVDGFWWYKHECDGIRSNLGCGNPRSDNIDDLCEQAPRLLIHSRFARKPGLARESKEARWCGPCFVWWSSFGGRGQSIVISGYHSSDIPMGIFEGTAWACTNRRYSIFLCCLTVRPILLVEPRYEAMPKPCLSTPSHHAPMFVTRLFVLLRLRTLDLRGATEGLHTVLALLACCQS